MGRPPRPAVRDGMLRLQLRPLYSVFKRCAAGNSNSRYSGRSVQRGAGISTVARTIATCCDKASESKAILSGVMSSGYVLHAVLKGAEASLKPFKHAGQLPAAGSM